MGFKDALQDDLDNVFFNQDEFVEIHSYNGKDIPVVIDDDNLTEMKLRSKNDRADGIFSCTKLILVKVSDIEDEPFVAQIVVFDGDTYYVKSVSVACDVYQIILGDNES